MENNQELMFKFQMFEQQIKQLQQQLEAVEQGIMEMTSLHLGLNDIVGAIGNEIMAPIGRGIFAKAKLISEELIVDVGGRNFVSKSVSETQEIIKEQLDKLDEIKNELNGNLEQINQDVTKTMIEAQQGKKCSHEGCECEESCDDCECEEE